MYIFFTYGFSKCKVIWFILGMKKGAINSKCYLDLHETGASESLSESLLFKKVGDEGHLGTTRLMSDTCQTQRHLECTLVRNA